MADVEKENIIRIQEDKKIKKDKKIANFGLLVLSFILAVITTFVCNT